MVDLAAITIKAGNGGDGAVSFLREKYKPKGGPDGGDGGDGGSIYIKAASNMATLMDFRSKRRYEAQNGAPGSIRNRKGPDGEDLIIQVPVGTLVYEKAIDRDILVADINSADKKILIAQGGKGGVGNFRFRSSTNQTPRQFVPGTKGEQKDIMLEVKIIADIGLIGMPNAGKSTLINYLTNAGSKVANYPFTTLTPHLGVMKLVDGNSVVLADIPGLIAGASEGKGLGDEFLRHTERTRILIHLIDAFPIELEKNSVVDTAVQNYLVIQKELEQYSTSLPSSLYLEGRVESTRLDLTKKPQIVVLNKTDITEIHENLNDIKAIFKKQFGVVVLGISAVTGEGIDELKKSVMKVLKDHPKTVEFDAEPVVKRYNINNLPNVRQSRNVSERPLKGYKGS